jgi:hypothetical protein
MSTAIRSSFVDHTGLDGTGDAINGNEVDENPNVIADILDGTLATDLAGAGTLDFVMTDTRAGIRLIDLSNAAAAIHEGLVLEWDPGDGGNLTDNSSGIGIDFKLPDDADAQTVFGSLNVVCVDDAAASTDGEFSFRVTAAGTDNVEQMTLSAAALTVTPPATITGLITATGGITSGSNIVSDTDSTDDLGTSSVRWANVYTDSIGDTGQDLTIAATTTNLPSGHVTDYAGADVVLTHSAGVLNVSTGALQVGGVAVATGTVFDPTATNTFTADQTFNDNVKVTLGTGGDADLYYDATNVVLNPKVVGSGVFNVLGNMGVGIARTDGTLHVHTASAGAVTANTGADDLVVENSGDAGISILTPTNAVGALYFGDSDSAKRGGIEYDQATGAMALRTTDNSTRLVIDASGNVGIGGTTTTSNWSPTAYLNIEGAIPAITLRDTTASADDWTFVNNNGTLTFANDTDNTFPMTITDAGVVNIANLTASSDVQTDGSKNLVSVSDSRLKTDRGTISDGSTAIINQITPRYFEYNSDIENGVTAKQLGFYAQEIAPLIPEAAPYSSITETQVVEGEEVEVEIDRVWGFNGRPIQAHLVKAFQELEARVTALEAV